MTESRNVLIPLELFYRIISLMNHIAFSNIRIPLMYDFEGTRELLEAKMKKINLHDIYSRAAYAKNENDRRIEINNYLKLKSRKSKSQY